MPEEDAAKARWKRKRMLLPTLKLEYPSDVESKTIASLAKINTSSVSSLSQSLRSIILDAHLNDAAYRKYSIPKVKAALQKVRDDALKLSGSLQDLDVKIGTGTNGSTQLAGFLLENELWKIKFREQELLIPDYLQLLAVVGRAAIQAATVPKAKRGPRAAGGNRAFDLFVESLEMVARMHGGRWTNYRSADGVWTGSLLKALDILKPYLPEKLFPPVELGRSVDNIRAKLATHVATHKTRV
jgi:hypothetical protein